jgi:hypothetical protein
MGKQIPPGNEGMGGHPFGVRGAKYQLRYAITPREFTGMFGKCLDFLLIR